MATNSLPEQGQLVQVRSRPWVVKDVKPSNLPTTAMKLPVSADDLKTLLRAARELVQHIRAEE